MAELRYNVVTRDWVIVAPERSLRPFERTGVLRPCPFCPGHEENTPDETLRFCDADGRWLVRAFPNRFPVVTAGEGALPSGVYPTLSRPAVGMHEVVAECPEHDNHLAHFAPHHLEMVVRAWRDRARCMLARPGIEHVIIFKNHGDAAGSSLSHAHSQIVGLPVLPVQVQVRLEEALRSYAAMGQCLFCQMIDDELRAQTRIVSRSRAFVAFVPYASFSPYSLWLFPLQHTSCFSLLGDDEVGDLAGLLGDVLGRLDRLLGNPPYNLVVRSISCETAGRKYFHYYLSIVPRLGKAAGFELGTGMFINPDLPETDAERLRNA